MIIRLHVTNSKQKIQSKSCPWKLIRERVFVWNYRWPWEKVSPSAFILPSLMEWNNLNAFRSNKYLTLSPIKFLFLTSTIHVSFSISASTCKMTEWIDYIRLQTASTRLQTADRQAHNASHCELVCGYIWSPLVNMKSSGNNLQFRHLASTLNPGWLTLSKHNTK